MTLSRRTPAWLARWAFAVFAALLTWMALPAAALAGPAVPPLTGPVVDEASMLDAQGRARLEALARAARAAQSGQGVQLQFLIIPSLEGEPIEDYSIRVAEKWKIGSRGADNGVLFTVARDDRRVRIEVGGGLEGGLTDAQAGRIIRQIITPAFRAGQYAAGLYDAGVQVLSALGAMPPDVAQPKGSAQPAPADGASVLGYAVALIVVVLLLAFWSRRSGGGGVASRGLGPWWLGGLGGLGGWSARRGWENDRGGGGGGRSNDGGSGGWGGGGGGFSGGGASGGW